MLNQHMPILKMLNSSPSSSLDWRIRFRNPRPHSLFSTMAKLFALEQKKWKLLKKLLRNLKALFKFINKYFSSSINDKIYLDCPKSNYVAVP